MEIKKMLQTGFALIVGLVVLLGITTFQQLVKISDLRMGEAPEIEQLGETPEFDEEVLQEEQVIIENVKNTILGVVLLIAALSIMIGYGTTRSIVSPMKKLLDITDKIGHGDLKVRLDKSITSSHSEIRRLGSAFKRMAKDLDDRYKELEEKIGELDAANSKNKTILGNIGDGIIFTDGKRRIIMMNNAAREILSVEGDELLGKKWPDSVKMVDGRKRKIPVKETALYNSLRSKKKVTKAKCSFLKKDKSVTHASITSNPVNAGGQTIGAILSFKDMTKEVELDKIKSEFVSLASHQLRTPLSTTKWFCELLMDDNVGEISDEQKEILDNIYHSNERMIALVANLLNVAKLEAESIVARKKKTDVLEILEEVVNELRPTINKKNIKVVVNTNKDVGAVNTDPNLVREIFTNLVSNAVKYTPNKGEILVFFSRTSQEIITQISDNGVGIPVDQQKNIFSKFFRAQNVQKHDTEGNGLGLYIAQSMTQLLDGRLYFKSKEGEGTSFFLHLPLK